jgi:serine/threonine protein kinase
MIPRELVPGKLRIIRRIRAGGMGVVYEANHLGLDRRVAVKVIHPQSSESAEARSRFFREARAMALLQSEHIVQVLDVDTLPNGDPYMVMEYLDGRDLKRELTKRGPLPLAEAVGYLIQATAGVAAAHGAGVIHRDIKPANIFITNLDGARRAKLLDFGVAKFAASADESLTGPTALLGTPLYMSPEQIAGLEADPCSDIWALGVVLFQVLTGHSPFRAKAGEGTVSAILNGAAPLLHEVRPDVPVALSQVVARCLERVHAQRFQGALELAAALAPFGPREPLVRASRRAPRGSSAPPPVNPLDDDCVQPVVEPRLPALRSAPEAITLTHPALAERVTTVPLVRAHPAGESAPGPLAQAGPATDSDRTVQFRAADPSPEQASRSLVSTSNHPGSLQRVRWRRFAAPLGSLFVLGVASMLALPLLVRPPGAASSARPPAFATPGTARPRALAAAAPIESAPPALAAPATAAPERAAPAVVRTRPALLDHSGRETAPATNSRRRPPLATPAPPVSSASVPLHL